MLSLKHFSVLGVLCASLALFSACSSAENSRTSDAGPDVSKPVAGDQRTEDYAERPVSVQDGQTDPYTGTQDKENYVGKHPIADEQTAGEKIGDDNNAKQNQQ